MDTRECELSDLNNIETFCENPQLKIDVGFRPKLGISFSPTMFKDLEMKERGPSKNPIVMDDDKGKKNSTQTTAVSERPTETTRLLRSRPFGWRIENAPDHVHSTLFEKVFNVRVCRVIGANQRFHKQHRFSTPVGYLRDEDCYSFLTLFLAATFCLIRIHTEKNVWQHI